MKLPDITLGKFTVGNGHNPFVIAGMLGYQNQSVDRAYAIVDAAAAAGAHSIKLQTCTADAIALDVQGDAFTWGLLE